jgi:hypothetical protein
MIYIHLLCLNVFLPPMVLLLLSQSNMLAILIDIGKKLYSYSDNMTVLSGVYLLRRC